MASYEAIVAFPVMRVGVRTEREQVSGIRYLPPATQELAPQNALAQKAVEQLERYRVDPDFTFDLPFTPEGTPLQLAVWEAMRRIPRGSTRSYGEIAREVGEGGRFGDEAALARAVGQACGDNRLPILIPCHRVVAADGLGGFSHTRSGFLIEAKAWLLSHERALLI
jgi:methylated-DNA-[protein]-cysteine S-methyltransferase